MADEYLHSPSRVANQLRDQLSSEKRKLGFFYGAGTSIAVGIPGVLSLTSKVFDKLEKQYKEPFDALRKKCGSENIEHVLNMLRTIRELIGDSDDEEIYKIKGREAGQKLDVEICKAISKIVMDSTTDEFDPHMTFCNWLFQNQATRHTPIEIFTSNYDLLIERALELKKLPYFDGFVGTIDSFLIPESVEAENDKLSAGLYVPFSWIRIWKIHGSINWFLTIDKEGKKRIIRSSHKAPNVGDELMIYPSKQKYDESRRLPFIVFQDRMRKFLANGEGLFVIAGYSFSDDHINEIIFESLRSNNRLAITALVYGEPEKNRTINEKVLRYGLSNPNFSILGPDKACIGGVIAKWDVDESEDEIFWDKEKKIFNLGDFVTFSKYLKMNFGVLAQIQNKGIAKISDQETETETKK
ncbi:MAG TPA: SIR2 family protein [Cytophagales bacterium]|jgi:hypothetical protein|nr:SIR2 family protein [Cytophagales bacterium]